MTIQGGLSASAVLVILSAGIAAAASPVGPKAPAPAAPARSAPAAPAPAEGHGAPLPPPQVSQDAAARSRMHECGHQWSTMKKAGTVGTMTWKEFSSTCLVVSK